MPSPTSIKPFLKEQPRVRYEHLEYIEDEASYDDEGAYLYQGKPFNGIAWNENRGMITEDTLRDGLRNGRCLKVYPNGNLAEDGEYKDDEPVGEVFKWYESGVLWHEYKYDSNSYQISHREYSPKGILVFESDREGVRHWSSEGVLMYEYLNRVRRYYAPNGHCTIEVSKKVKAEEREAVVYDDEALYFYVSEMLMWDSETVKTAVFQWLQSKLDSGDPRAYTLLISLLEHPEQNIVSTALSNIGFRACKEAIPKIRSLIDKHRRSLNQIFQGAIVAYARLTGQADTDKLMEDYYRAVAELEKSEELRRLKVKKTWPKTEAHFLETYTGVMSLRSGTQIFSDKAAKSRIEYIHVYRYQVGNYTYRATFNTGIEEPDLIKTIHYRMKNPAEYIFYDNENRTE